MKGRRLWRAGPTKAKLLHHHIGDGDGAVTKSLIGLSQFRLAGEDADGAGFESGVEGLQEGGTGGGGSDGQTGAIERFT